MSDTFGSGGTNYGFSGGFAGPPPQTYNPDQPVITGHAPAGPQTPTYYAEGTATPVGSDAQAVIQETLNQYGLGGLSQWAWDEVTSGASTNQILLNMYSTPQFQQRFPGIFQRQRAGLPPISPADYVSYEDQMKQLENQYGLPQGALSNPTTVGNYVGGDVSANEVTSRVQNGYAQVAYAPAEVRQAFTAMFGVGGDGALAHFFLDPKRSLPMLEQQATAAQLSGTAAMGSVNISTNDAMKLAQMGQSAQGFGSTVTKLDQEAPLFSASVGEQQNLAVGKEGLEAATGLNAAASQEVLQRQQEREAAFSGGGGAEVSTTGTTVGAAKPV